MPVEIDRQTASNLRTIPRTLELLEQCSKLAEALMPAAAQKPDRADGPLDPDLLDREVS